MPVTEGFDLEGNLPDAQGAIQGETPVPTQKRGEFGVRLKGQDQSIDLSIPLLPQVSRGVTNNLVLVITGKNGINPATMDFELFDTDISVEMIANSEKTIFRNVAMVIDAAVPQLMFSLLLERNFSLKGNPSRLGVRLSYSGGGAATDFQFNIQVNGNRR